METKKTAGEIGEAIGNLLQPGKPEKLMNIPTITKISEEVLEFVQPPPGTTQTIVADGRPETVGKDTHWFILPGNNMSISDSACTIFSEIGPTHTLFYRGGSVVEIDKSADLAEFKLIESAHFCSRIEKYGMTVGAYVKNPNTAEYALSQKVCQKESAEKLMAAMEAEELLPRVSAISNCALLVQENSQPKILTPGYHPDLGGVYISQEEPTREVDLAEAVPAINSLLDDFKFQSEADKSRAVASLLTPALKFGGHISGNIPVDVGEADLSQSGKSYRQQVVAAIYGEKVQVVTQVRGIGGGDEPFFNALCRGRPFIQFDNWRGKLDSPTLESFITINGDFGIRGAYKKWGSVDSRKFYLMLSSNGFESTQDFCNRSNIIRIAKQPENYQFKTYSEGGLLQHVECHQNYYLGCVFSVIRSWLSSGKPTTEDKRHDFREWCQICDWIVQEIFGFAPLMDGHQEAKQRVTNPHMTWLRKIALAAKSRKQLGQNLNATDIVDLGDEESIDLPGTVKPADANAAKRKVGSIMRKLFGETSVLECEDFAITRDKILAPRSDRPNENAPMPVYVFTEKCSP